MLKESTAQKLNIVSMDLVLKISSKVDDFMKNLGVKDCWLTNEEQGKGNYIIVNNTARTTVQFKSLHVIN